MTPKPAAPTMAQAAAAVLAAPAPVQVTVPEADADETPDRFDVLAKIIRILKPLPPSERHSVVASLAEMVQ